ncbi:MAG: fluoride efflux transporter CrcB, partial [Elusimicrobia bacterium]|nr:fluoride efflux transporter CrcB [Elusimicrobiota bacterium]
RYGLAGLVYGRMGTSFPHGTLAVNLFGCFLIGLFDGLAEEKFLLGPNARILLMTGFCGAFTTFSTFMLETAGLIRDGEIVRALFNVGLSLVAGFILFLIGNVLAKAL